MSIEQVQWTDQPIPTAVPFESDGTYRGLRVHAEISRAGYGSWTVAGWRFADCEVLAHAYGLSLTLDQTKSHALAAADRLLAAGAEPRDRLAVAS